LSDEVPMTDAERDILDKKILKQSEEKKQKEEPKRVEGWAFLWNSKKVHYFRDKRSLCGKWLCLSMEFYPDENLNSPDNCAECRRRRAKELEKR
jgi:hypothetical protein